MMHNVVKSVISLFLHTHAHTGTYTQRYTYSFMEERKINTFGELSWGGDHTIQYTNAVL